MRYILLLHDSEKIIPDAPSLLRQLQNRKEIIRFKLPFRNRFDVRVTDLFLFDRLQFGGHLPKGGNGVAVIGKTENQFAVSANIRQEAAHLVFLFGQFMLVKMEEAIEQNKVELIEIRH